jgi:hypothetical protein
LKGLLAYSVVQKERDAGAGAYVPEEYRRGVDIKDKVACAQIAQSETREANQNIRELLIACASQHHALLKELGMINQMIADAEGNENLVETYRNWQNDVITKIRDLGTRRMKLEEESDRLHNQGTKAQVAALYDQIGSFPNKKSKAPVTVIEVSGENNEDASAFTSAANGGLTVTDSSVVNHSEQEKSDEDSSSN